MIAVPSRRGRLFFFDETDVHWCPDTGRLYQLPCSQVKINSPGLSQVRYLLGSIEYPTGEGLYELYSRKRNEEVEAHLRNLLSMCGDDFCFVVWDNASQHTTPMLWPFLLENRQRLLTIPLPTYSPHLNLIEKLWWYMRQKITRNHFYEEFSQLCEALVGWLKRLPFDRFCSLIGITPKTKLLAA